MSLSLRIVFLVIVANLLLVFGFNTKTSAFDLFGRTCSNDIVNNDKNTNSSVCEANNNAKSDTRNNNAVTRTINTIANILAAVAGVFAIINIILGGFLFATSAGNSENVALAKRRITHSLIGLIIVVMAWTITKFIINQVI